MIPPRSPSSIGSNFLGEWNRRTSHDRAPSALHGDAIFLRETNFIFSLLISYYSSAAQHTRWLKVNFFREWSPFFLVRFVEMMHTN